MSSVIERFGGAGRVDLAAGLVMRAGSMRDYAALAEFHYLRQRPATATRVIVLEDRRVGIAERFRAMARGGPGDGGGEGDSAAAGSARVAAVLVESLPALACRLRDEALGGRYAGWADRAMGARLLNAEVRCISRVVVHPQWRGVGLAVRLVRQALRTMTTPYTEAIAAMGRVHPFFERAGMRAYARHPSPADERLRAALRFCGAEPWELACPTRVAALLAGPHAAVLRRELRRWAGRGTVEQQIARARERLMVSRVYYLAHRRGAAMEQG